MTTVLKVSKEGFDVLDTDPKNLIFDSTKNQLKVARVLTEAVTTTGSGKTVTVPHGLEYVPGFIPFVRIGTRWYGNVGDDPINGFQWQFAADTTNIYFYLSDPGAAVQELTVKVYVFVDGATDVTTATNAVNPIGISVSQPGHDVLSASDQELSLSTGFVEAIQIKEIVSINAVASSTDYSTAHNLGYTPAWIGVVVDNAGTFFATNTAFLVPYLLIGTSELMVWSDLTNITARAETVFSPDFTFKIAILTNRLE